MGKQEIKTEINKALEEVPEAVLQQILDLLKQFQTKTSNDLVFLKNLDKLLNEDDELLRKLAQ